MALVLIPADAHAQSADRVDPQTGNYVQQVDPFMRGAPDSDGPNPNRLDNRQARHGAFRLGPEQNTAQTGEGIPQANAISAPPPAVTLPLVPLGDMAMYTRPSQENLQADPFAKPDWWPQ